MKALNVLPGLGSGGAERLTANVMPALDRERVEIRRLGLLGPLFGMDLEETLAQHGIFLGQLGKREDFGPQPFVRIARVQDWGGSHGGSALSLYPQVLVQRAPSLDKCEGAR